MIRNLLAIVFYSLKEFVLSFEGDVLLSGLSLVILNGVKNLAPPSEILRTPSCVRCRENRSE